MQVLACGSVAKVLPDDNKESRHQRFLIKIDNYPKMSVLVAHNIDLAPKVKNIQPNTPIKIYGEYIYNEKRGGCYIGHTKILPVVISMVGLSMMVSVIGEFLSSLLSFFNKSSFILFVWRKNIAVF